MLRKSPLLISATLHLGAVVLLLLITLHPAMHRPLADAVRVFQPLHAPRFHSSGGGGQRNPLPASRGAAPPVAIHKVFIPPMVVVNQNPRLAVEQAILEAPEVNIQSSVSGDPMGKTGMLSGGPGGPFGIGDGGGQSIGPGPDDGRGGFGPGPRTITHLTRNPQLLHMEEPEYSEEARKARYQGTVILAIEVGLDGRATKFRVLQSLGLGLDEKAMEAVRKWKFRPAIAGDRPVAAPATVEVTFHLL